MAECIADKKVNHVSHKLVSYLQHKYPEVSFIRWSKHLYWLDGPAEQVAMIQDRIAFEQEEF